MKTKVIDITRNIIQQVSVEFEVPEDVSIEQIRNLDLEESEIFWELETHLDIYDAEILEYEYDISSSPTTAKLKGGEFQSEYDKRVKIQLPNDEWLHALKEDGLIKE